jgi:hypothetical protein
MDLVRERVERPRLGYAPVQHAHGSDNVAV